MDLICFIWLINTEKMCNMKISEMPCVWTNEQTLFSSSEEARAQACQSFCPSSLNLHSKIVPWQESNWPSFMKLTWEANTQHNMLTHDISLVKYHGGWSTDLYFKSKNWARRRFWHSALWQNTFVCLLSHFVKYFNLWPEVQVTE